MGKRPARQVFEYDSMEDFEADGGVENYGNGLIIIGNKLLNVRNGQLMSNINRKTVAFLGDSYVVRDTPSILSGFLGYGQKSIFEWTNIHLRKRLKPIYNGYNNADGKSAYDGITGTTITDFLSRIDSIIALGADYVWVTGSVNNSRSSSYVSLEDRISGYTTIINKIISAGQIPIITTEPTSEFLDGTTKYNDWHEWNTWLKTVGRSFGALVADYQYDIADPASLTGKPIYSLIDTVDSTPNRVHRSWRAAMLAGKAAADSLDKYIPEWEAPWVSVYDGSATGKRIQIVKNPIMIDSNADGVADNWGPGGTGVVASIEARTDGILGNKQVLTWTPAAVGGTAFCPTSGGGLSMGDKVVGDTIEVFIELEIGDTNASMVGGFLNVIVFNGASGVTSKSYQFFDYAGSGQGLTKGFSGVVSTPEVIIPPGTTSFSIQNTFYAANTGLPVVIKIGRVCVN